MNNEQFRRLLVNNASGKNAANSSGEAAGGATPGGGLLGSRQRSSIPMTPRTVKGSAGIDFARQLAERNGTQSSGRKFRSAAPKGSRLATGYRDRTGERIDEDEDEKAQRIKALEEQMKLGQIDRETFEKIRDEITAGDVHNTHLVKGLDWKLLQRIRMGEDVHTEKKEETPADLDEEFEDLEKAEVVAVKKEEKQKKGEMAPPPPVAGVKRSRDQILAELKASRKRAADERAAEQQVSTKFRRIGNKMETSRIEIDDRGREVLIVTDTDGNIKRKVKKGRADESALKSDLLMPDKDAKPLGMEVPDIVQPAEESDDDIYADIKDDYNPLADLGEDDSSSGEEGEAPGKPSKISGEASHAKEPNSESKPDKVLAENESNATTTLSRNYFNDDPSTLSVLSKVVNPLEDPEYLAALFQKSKEKAALNDPSAAMTADSEEDRLKRRAAMLMTSDRDLEDMDMGFGSSRFDDAEEMAMDGSRVKLSEWGGDGDDEDGDKKGGGKQRKRGPKKRRGDKNNVSDVLRVMESQKK